MSEYENVNYPGRAVPSADAQAFDQGLRTYMIGVYQYMALGVALTGAVALVLSMQPALMEAIWATPLRWVAIFAPVPIGLYAQIRIHKLSPATAQGLFWLYAALMGVSFSILFAIYTDASIARVFLITAVAFGSLSLFGYTTKRNLSAFGSFLFIGMVGIFVASVANIFLASSALNFAVSVIGVLVFAGLTAYDTQQIKQMYYDAPDETTASRYAVLGAFWLYISFVAMFQYLLALIGDRD